MRKKNVNIIIFHLTPLSQTEWPFRVLYSEQSNAPFSNTDGWQLLQSPCFHMWNVYSIIDQPPVWFLFVNFTGWKNQLQPLGEITVKGKQNAFMNKKLVKAESSLFKKCVVTWRGWLGGGEGTRRGLLTSSLGKLLTRHINKWGVFNLSHLPAFPIQVEAVAKLW